MRNRRSFYLFTANLCGNIYFSTKKKDTKKKIKEVKEKYRKFLYSKKLLKRLRKRTL